MCQCPFCVFLHVLGASGSKWSKKQKVVVFWTTVVVAPPPFVLRTNQNYQCFFDVAPNRAKNFWRAAFSTLVIFLTWTLFEEAYLNVWNKCSKEQKALSKLTAISSGSTTVKFIFRDQCVLKNTKNYLYRPFLNYCWVQSDFNNHNWLILASPTGG